MNSARTNKCLYCYRQLDVNTQDFHSECSKKFFGTRTPPELNYTTDQVSELAESVIKRSVSVPGVQPKLSLHFERHSRSNAKGNKRQEGDSRLTIVGLWGEYIFKPPTEDYPELPENEDVTLHLAEIAGIRTVPHSLIRFKSGELAYISRRIDRVGRDGSKLHTEDMCQLTERLTEDKYHGSMERIGKTILRYSSNPGLDAVNYFSLAVFCYLTGNSDMHLKNFSLIHVKLDNLEEVVTLAPAYDLVATKLLIPSDEEELALTLNGKKSKLKLVDFDQLATQLEINKKARDNVYDGLKEKRKQLVEFINSSFLSNDSKEAYIKLLAERFRNLFQ